MNGADIRWGIRFGLILATLLIAFVSLGYVLRPDSPSHQSIGWLEVSSAYLAGGIVCGLVLGICKPLFTSLSRSILLGPVVAFPFYVIVGTVADSPFWTWDAANWAIAVVASLIVGSIVGGSFWGIFNQASFHKP